MFKRFMTVSLLALSALALQWPAVSQTTPPTFYVTDLGVISNADSSNATAINDNGWVVGYTPLSRSVSYYRGWVWAPNASNPTQGTLSELKPAYAAPNPLAYEICQPTDITTSGMIIGYSASRISGDRCATFWLTPNVPVDFNTLLPDPNEWVLRFATAVSEPGPDGEFYVCGVARHVTNPTTDVGVVWRVSGGVITGVTALDIAPGLTNPRSNASDINSFGEMTGTSHSTPASGTYHPYVWEPSGQGQFLGSLGTGNTQPFAINDGGVIMGWDSTLRKAWVRFPSTGTMTLLPTLSGGTQAYPMGMNNLDDIVGFSGSSKGQKACLWHDGAPYDLNNFKSGGASKTNLVTASAINNGGSITATYESRATRAVLLTPQ